jgi:hypothetical protein
VDNPECDKDQKAEEHDNARRGVLSTGSSQVVIVGLVISDSSRPLFR